MALRREDRFPFVVTSDGCRDTYPDNRPEDFKISLREPLDFDSEDEWEVALTDLQYPVSWVNIGGRTNTKMFYYVGGIVQQLNFPEWHCRDLEELVAYMKSELPKEFDVKVDAFGRFKISSEGLFCEVAMNLEMMRVLGISGRTEDEIKVLSESSLRTRAGFKLNMRRFWKKKNPLEFDEYLIEDITEAADDYVAVAKLLKDHVALHVLSGLKLNAASSGMLKSEVGKKISENIDKIAEALGVGTVSPELAGNFAFFYNQVISFCQVEKPPKEIVGSSRGVLGREFDQLFIHSNIIEAVDLNDGVSDILRIVKSREDPGGTIQEMFSRPMYHPVRKGGKISLIHVSIRDANGDLVPFRGGTVLMTLEFRRRRV
jgi:hypothetical protein